MNMELNSLFMILILLATTIILRKSKRAGKNAPHLPPGPRPLPVVGNLHQLYAGSLRRSLLALSRRYGPLMFLRLGSIPTLVVSSSGAAEELFRRHDLAISGRPLLAAPERILYNNSSITFSTYGDYWRQARKITTIALLNSRRVWASAGVREQEVAKLVAAISATDKKPSDSPCTVNLNELTASMSNNILCGVAFGAEHGVGRNGYDAGARLREVISETQRMFGSFSVEDFFPGMAWVDRLRGLHARMKKNSKDLDEIICEHVEKVGMEDNSDGEENLLQVLLRLHKAVDSSRGGFLSHIDHVKGILEDVFLAGTETASVAITWTMTELMRNPRVMEKLQQELQQMFGSKRKLIEEAELEKLEYLKLVVKESLRLHPPGPLLVPRETIEPCTIQGFHIPAKTRVLINAAAIAIDPNVWERPLEFWPERFQDGKTDFRGQDFEFIPFGAGRRMCPGMNFGIAVVELSLANLLHCFDWTMPEGMKAEDIDMEEEIGISSQKKEHLRLVAKSKW